MITTGIIDAIRRTRSGKLRHRRVPPLTAHQRIQHHLRQRQIIVQHATMCQSSGLGVNDDELTNPRYIQSLTDQLRRVQQHRDTVGIRLGCHADGSAILRR